MALRRWSDWLMILLLLAVGAWFVLSTVFPVSVFDASHEQVWQCEEQMRTVAAALTEYEADWGEWPPSLDTLVPEYVGDAGVLRCPVPGGACVISGAGPEARVVCSGLAVRETHYELPRFRKVTVTLEIEVHITRQGHVERVVARTSSEADPLW